MTETALTAEDTVRARLYRLLGRALSAPPDRALLEAVRSLPGDRHVTPLGAALAQLAAAATSSDEAATGAQYQRLFIGVGRGELVPYASWYLTGYIGERPLVRLRDDMRALGIARAEDVHEPEDHIAALCEMMSGMITGEFGAGTGQDRQEAFFADHLAPWAPRFFADLAAVRDAPFYAALGELGHAFLDLEAAILHARPGP